MVLMEKMCCTDPCNTNIYGALIRTECGTVPKLHINLYMTSVTSVTTKGMWSEPEN